MNISNTVLNRVRQNLFGGESDKEFLKKYEETFDYVDPDDSRGDENFFWEAMTYYGDYDNEGEFIERILKEFVLPSRRDYYREIAKKQIIKMKKIEKYMHVIEDYDDIWMERFNKEHGFPYEWDIATRLYNRAIQNGMPKEEAEEKYIPPVARDYYINYEKYIKY